MNNVVYVNKVESAKLNACMHACMQCANDVFIADREVLKSEKRRKAKRK